MQILQQLQRRWQVDLARPENAIVIAGSGRSGTTWIGNVIAAATHSRTIFEPFLHNEQRRLVLSSHRAEHQIDRQIYLSSAAEPDQTTRKFIETVLSGRLRTSWTEQQSQPGIYRSRVIKAIRANLMLGWLAREYPELKIIWIVRDPISVIQSQLRKVKQGWQFGWQPDYALSQPELMHRQLEPYRSRIESAHSLIEQLACKWCIETRIPLHETADCPNVLRLCYDKLCQEQPDEIAWQAVATFLQPVGWSHSRALRVGDQRSFTSLESQPAGSARLLPTDAQSLIRQVIDEFELTELVSQISNPVCSQAA